LNLRVIPAEAPAIMRIYFMSICGTGMGNAALLFRQAGHEVLGADQNIYPPMSDVLAQAGIEVLPGFDAERLARLAPDLVVVGNVNTRGNPEVEWLLETRAIPYTSLPEALNRLILKHRRNVVIAGTHGKTTTTTLAAFLLRSTGHQPGWMLGGAPRDLPAGFALGAPDAPFIIEGDEYDSAFFDKRSKFIHYAPDVAVINNLEFDHADIFRDLQDVERTFNHFLRLVPRSGWIIYNGDDPHLSRLLPVTWAQNVTVGTGPENDLVIRGFREGPQGSSFQLVWRGTVWGKVEWKLPGLFNARNAAMAALAAGLAIKPDDPFCAIDLSKLSPFQGVRRRQEILMENETTTIVSDFGHHPTAIAETLESLRARYPKHQLTLAWEARSNTACRKILQDAFTAAFRHADRIHLGTIFRAERYTDDNRINLQEVAAALGPKSTIYPDNHALRRGLEEELAAQPKQCVVFFSNGSFDGIIAEVAATVSSASQCS